MSKQKVAFIGLGVMGYPMAGHLAKAGFQTRVYNRTAAKAEQWCQDYEGDFATTPREAADGADFVFMCVGNDEDLRSVVYGDDGSILVDHTTASANVAREIADKAQVAFLDAPVSGGQAGAENGVLTVMIGGHRAERTTMHERIDRALATMIEDGFIDRAYQARLGVDYSEILGTAGEPSSP